ncbi:MAG: ribosomal RNA small subunit methyltransferase A, partial [Firmicutes bacterium]|nr:ribosomal RNA small subunit methyltransferase A [Bacillota bacterium]
SLLPILEETLGEFDNVRVINEDILKLDLNEVISEEGLSNVKIMGNLPYYITTPIIMKILEDGVNADSITIMMQKEVADRIKAAPGSKVYGALSVAVQYYCTVDKVANVPRSMFVPQPNVDSIVLRLNIRKEKPVELANEKLFFDCVKAGFGQRRKTLLNSLQNIKGVTKEIILESLQAAGVDAGRRAETLNLEEFAMVANEVNKRL